MNDTMMHNDSASLLARFDADFANAEVEERGDVPDGKYQVNVEKVEITTAKSSGNPMLKWTLRILGPTQEGRCLWRHNVMATRENIKWLKTDLHACGLTLERLSDLPAHLDRLLDVKLEVTKRTKDGSENVYINRRIVLDEAAGAGGKPATRQNPFVNDSLPF